MNKVLISAIIKDAELWITQFLSNISALNDNDNLDIDYLFIEGNSTDKTYSILSNWIDDCNQNVILIKHDLPEEMERIDRVMDSIELIPEVMNFYNVDTDYIMLIDADIIETDMLTTLIAHMESYKVDIIAPYVLIASTNRFYDTHVFRMNNKNFSAAPPYTPNKKGFNSPFEVDSAGACLLFKSNIFIDVIRENKKYRKEYNSQKKDGYLGLCKTAKLMNYRIFVDPTVRIYHINLIKHNIFHRADYWC